MVSSIILSLIFFLLASIHIYWTFGGRWGFDVSLPKKTTGEKLMNPKIFDCIVVALALLSFSIFYLNKSSLLDLSLPIWLTKHAGWFIVVIFAFRAIGEFKYVGFFKKIKHTDFAIIDSRFFSPLCSIISILALLIQLS